MLAASLVQAPLAARPRPRRTALPRPLPPSGPPHAAATCDATVCSAGRRGLTPYQGSKRCFGYYKCSRCGRKWMSGACSRSA